MRPDVVDDCKRDLRGHRSEEVIYRDYSPLAEQTRRQRKIVSDGGPCVPIDVNPPVGRGRRVEALREPDREVGGNEWSPESRRTRDCLAFP